MDDEILQRTESVVSSHGVLDTKTEVQIIFLETYVEKLKNIIANLCKLIEDNNIEELNVVNEVKNCVTTMISEYDTNFSSDSKN